MQERGYTTTGASYRFGFNGQERDDEVAGEGSSNTATFWQYDGRIGRRWNVDPILKEYESPYTCLGNNPIWIIDPNGDDSLIVHRSEGEKVGNVMHYKLTFSIIRNGSEETVELELQQATKYAMITNGQEQILIQAPENSDVELKWQQMNSHNGDEGYENTIRVVIPYKKSDGSEYSVFMHPTSYTADWLAGCCATAAELDKNGMPVGESKQDRFDASVLALKQIRDLYNLVETNKVIDGEVGFIMRTNSVAPKIESTPAKSGITLPPIETLPPLEYQPITFPLIDTFPIIDVEIPEEQ